MDAPGQGLRCRKDPALQALVPSRQAISISIYPQLSGQIGFARLRVGRQPEMKQVLQQEKGKSLPATLRGPISACVHRISSASEILQLHEEALQWAEASVRSAQPANDASAQGHDGT